MQYRVLQVPTIQELALRFQSSSGGLYLEMVNLILGLPSANMAALDVLKGMIEVILAVYRLRPSEIWSN